MKSSPLVSRRGIIKSSILGSIAVSLPNILFAKEIKSDSSILSTNEELFHRYPSIDDEIVSEVVGKSHFNLDRVKELVDARPELSRATWDWSFGDWESALGAASHVGRRDIATYLISKGARPDIYTFAMFGHYQAVKAMIEATPGIESISGPHGISLLSHVKSGQRSDDLTTKEKDNAKQLVDYLERLGTADKKEINLEFTTEERDRYLGDYKYGDGEKDGFSVRLNMRENLCLGKLGSFGGALFHQGNNEFLYNGITSVKVTFEVSDNQVISLTVDEPDLSLRAIKL